MSDDQDWSSVVMRWPSWFADLIADLVAEQDVTMSELVQSLASRGLPEPGEDPFGASYKRVVWAGTEWARRRANDPGPGHEPSGGSRHAGC